MEKIDMDWKTTNLKSLAKLFNRDWAPLSAGILWLGNLGSLLFFLDHSLVNR